MANFGLLYGAGAATLQKQAIAQYGVDMNIDEAREIVEGFRSAYPKLLSLAAGGRYAYDAVRADRSWEAPQVDRV